MTVPSKEQMEEKGWGKIYLTVLVFLLFQIIIYALISQYFA